MSTPLNEKDVKKPRLPLSIDGLFDPKAPPIERPDAAGFANRPFQGPTNDLSRLGFGALNALQFLDHYMRPLYENPEFDRILLEDLERLAASGKKGLFGKPLITPEQQIKLDDMRAPSYYDVKTGEPIAREPRLIPIEPSLYQKIVPASIRKLIRPKPISPEEPDPVIQFAKGVGKETLKNPLEMFDPSGVFGAAATTIPGISKTFIKASKTPFKRATVDLANAIPLKGPHGSNPGGWFEIDGVPHYVKMYKNQSQARTEVLANEIYKQIFKVNAPESSYDDLGRFYSKKVESEYPNIDNFTKEEARVFLNGFVGDVLLANWDVIKGDNIRKAANGIFRIDNGENILFRAQGKYKNFEDLNKITEWDRFFEDHPKFKAIFEKSGYSMEDFENLAKAQIQNLPNDWAPFVDNVVGDMNEADKLDTIQTLNNRTKLLKERFLGEVEGVSKLSPKQWEDFSKNIVIENPDKDFGFIPTANGGIIRDDKGKPVFSFFQNPDGLIQLRYFSDNGTEFFESTDINSIMEVVNSKLGKPEAPPKVAKLEPTENQKLTYKHIAGEEITDEALDEFHETVNAQAEKFNQDWKPSSSFGYSTDLNDDYDIEVYKSAILGGKYSVLAKHKLNHEFAYFPEFANQNTTFDTPEEAFAFAQKLINKYGIKKHKIPEPVVSDIFTKIYIAKHGSDDWKANTIKPVQNVVNQIPANWYVDSDGTGGYLLDFKNGKSLVVKPSNIATTPINVLEKDILGNSKVLGVYKNEQEAKNAITSYIEKNELVPTKLPKNRVNEDKPFKIKTHEQLTTDNLNKVNAKVKGPGKWMPSATSIGESVKQQIYRAPDGYMILYTNEANGTHNILINKNGQPLQTITGLKNVEEMMDLAEAYMQEFSKHYTSSFLNDVLPLNAEGWKDDIYGRPVINLPIKNENHIGSNQITLQDDKLILSDGTYPRILENPTLDQIEEVFNRAKNGEDFDEIIKSVKMGLKPKGPKNNATVDMLPKWMTETQKQLALQNLSNAEIKKLTNSDLESGIMQKIVSPEVADEIRDAYRAELQDVLDKNPEVGNLPEWQQMARIELGGPHSSGLRYKLNELRSYFMGRGKADPEFENLRRTFRHWLQTSKTLKGGIYDWAQKGENAVSDEMKDNIIALYKALRREPRDGPQLYRGWTAAPKDNLYTREQYIEYLKNKFKVGEVTNLAPSSFSIDLQIAREFADPTYRVIYYLDPGSRALKIMNFANPNHYAEQEYITGGHLLVKDMIFGPKEAKIIFEAVPNQWEALNATRR